MGKSGFPKTSAVLTSSPLKQESVLQGAQVSPTHNRANERKGKATQVIS